MTERLSPMSPAAAGVRLHSGRRLCVRVTAGAQLPEWLVCQLNSEAESNPQHATHLTSCLAFAKKGDCVNGGGSAA